MAASTDHTEINLADLDLSAREATPVLKRLQGLGFFGIGAGLIGLILGVVMGAASRDPNPVQTVFQGYVYGFTFWTMLTLGCLFLLLLHNIIKATWSLSILRIVEAGTKPLLYMGVLGVPLLASVLAGKYIGYQLYIWADPAVVAADKVLQHKAIYLNPVAWAIRYVLFFAIWVLYRNFLVRSGLEQERTRDLRLMQKRVDWASPGLVLFIVTLTFATTDWLMSLDPHWFSTIYGAWWGVSSVLNAMAFCVMVFIALSNVKPFSYISTPAVLKDLGNMLLAPTMVWAYFSISQFLIYWSGNLPEYVTFFVNRFRGPWVYVGAFLIFGQFFGPFVALIAGRTKRTYHLLFRVAAWIFVMRIIDVLYQTVPFFGWTLTADNIGGILVAFASWAFVGGVWISVFINELRRNPLIATYDTRLLEAKLSGGHH
jgi:hypothetical protein